ELEGADRDQENYKINQLDDQVLMSRRRLEDAHWRSEHAAIKWTPHSVNSGSPITAHVGLSHFKVRYSIDVVYTVPKSPDLRESEHDSNEPEDNYQLLLAIFDAIYRGERRQTIRQYAKWIHPVSRDPRTCGSLSAKSIPETFLDGSFPA